MLAKIRTEEFFAACERAITFWSRLKTGRHASMSQAEIKMTYDKKIARCTQMSMLCAAVRNTETHVQVTPEDFELVQDVWEQDK